MPKYELIDTFSLRAENTILHHHCLPEIVHLNDPAISVMNDFTQLKPVTIAPTLSMTHALNEMKIQGVHIFLVKSNEHIIGLISSEDILGAKPIQMIQERRINRDKVTVAMLMTPIERITAFHLKAVQQTKVGNVVVTLQKNHQHYALVVDDAHSNGEKVLCGMFSTWQISRQLHMDLEDSIEKAKSISELQRRKTK
ncbi:MAG: hypothetical protein A3F10_04575 [Coxiella sp. RIFCSPHIGHO2_12_FULL_42_15]|nr:MAG: hypothetical protein A3F10_04575 [Coxiella sp. RIFCSPHIGHO2_12_FULL_42_15]